MVRITIDTDNAAFESDPGVEVARILTDLAAKFEVTPPDLLMFITSYKVADRNGNTVGKVEVSR